MERRVAARQISARHATERIPVPSALSPNTGREPGQRRTISAAIEGVNILRGWQLSAARAYECPAR